MPSNSRRPAASASRLSARERSSSSASAIPASGYRRKMPSESSRAFSKARAESAGSIRAPAWAWRSLAGWWRCTADGSGSRAPPAKGATSPSRSRSGPCPKRWTSRPPPDGALAEQARDQRDRDEHHDAGRGELQWARRDPRAQAIPEQDGNRRDGPERQGGGDKHHQRLLIARLERRGGQLRHITPLGDEDHNEGGDERPAVPCLFVLDRLLLSCLHRAEVAPNEQRRHHQEQQPGSDANRLAREEAEQRAGQAGHGALPEEEAGRPQEDGERPMPGREQQ